MKRNILFFLYFILIIPLLLSQSIPENQNHSQKNRLIFLGLDGLDAELTQKWMQEGYLPNLQKLANQGNFQHLGTSNPAQSPVAWTTLATGTNPGQHNIFDFLRRGEKSYHPRLGLADVENITISNYWINLVIASIIGAICGLFWFSIPIYRRKKIYIKIISGTAIFIALTTWIILNYNLPHQIPWPKSLKHGESVWRIASKNNITTVILDAPMDFPAESLPNGRLYCGLGVPDVAATNGIWFRYSTSITNPIPTETGGWKMPLQYKKKSLWEGSLPGPKNLLAIEEYETIQQKLKNTTDFITIKNLRNRLNELKPYITLPFSVQTKDEKSLEIVFGDIREIVELGQWSKWLSLTFAMNKLIKIKGIVRIRVLQIDPLDIYVTPVQFDPNETPINIAISAPKNFSKIIAKNHGIYPTLGWPEATNALKDQEIPEEVFWEEMKDIYEQRRSIFLYELQQKKDWQLLMGFFYAPDRASHIYWRFINPKHPHFKEPEYQKWKDALLKVYQWCDQLVGDTLKFLGENDRLIVVSDHGFAAFDWEVNLNTWLLENEYLVLKKDYNTDKRFQINDMYEAGTLGQQVDWEKTRAYSMGLGGIYLNLKNRDIQGIVESGEIAKKLTEEIQQKLQELKHNGQNVIQGVYSKEQIYKGPFVSEAPDLVVGFKRGYRVAWQSTLGAVSKSIIEPNKLKWSGDHCSIDPSLIPGILFCNHPLKNKENPHLLDIAPSILDYFNIKIPSNMEGESLWKK